MPTISHRYKTSNLQFLIGVNFLSSLAEKFLKHYWLAQTTLGLFSTLPCLREPSQFKFKSRNVFITLVYFLSCI